MVADQSPAAYRDGVAEFRDLFRPPVLFENRAVVEVIMPTLFFEDSQLARLMLNEAEAIPRPPVG